MATYDDLPDVEREILRVLWKATMQVLTAPEICARVYYPDTEINQALEKMVTDGTLYTLTGNRYKPDAVGYAPSSTMFAQMSEKRDEANQRLAEGRTAIIHKLNEIEKGLDDELNRNK